MEKSHKTEDVIVVRYPPSPTGNLHVGNARTAIFNWLFARHYGGRIILRFEDTDKARSKPEYEKNILEGLAWLGLDFDEGVETPIRQSERTALYRRHLESMLTAGTAYISREPSKNDPENELELVRLKNENRRITFHDMIRGDISFDTTELSDIVIAKSLDEPLYHFTVVVDDHTMGVTHVIRGEDHISNTPRQILIQEALGVPRPIYAHIPLILAKDRSKLSKRHGAVSVTEYRKMGYLPEAFLNYLALLGWSDGSDTELFDTNELIHAFTINGVHKSGAVFDLEKLDWVNREHLKKLSNEAFEEHVLPRLKEALADFSGYTDSMAAKLMPLLRERVAKLSDIDAMVADGDVQYFFADPEYSYLKLFWKKEGSVEKTKVRLETASELLLGVDGRWEADVVEVTLMSYAEREGKGEVLWPVRVALCGKERSPNPFFIAGAIGKEATLRRLQTAVRKLEAEN